MKPGCGYGQGEDCQDWANRLASSLSEAAAERDAALAAAGSALLGPLGAESGVARAEDVADEEVRLAAELQRRKELHGRRQQELQQLRFQRSSEAKRHVAEEEAVEEQLLENRQLREALQAQLVRQAEEDSEMRKEEASAMGRVEALRHMIAEQESALKAAATQRLSSEEMLQDEHRKATELEAKLERQEVRLRRLQQEDQERKEREARRAMLEGALSDLKGALDELGFAGAGDMEEHGKRPPGTNLLLQSSLLDAAAQSLRAELARAKNEGRDVASSASAASLIQDLRERVRQSNLEQTKTRPRPQAF